MNEITLQDVETFAAIATARRTASGWNKVEHEITETPKYFKVWFSYGQKSIMAFVAKKDGRTKELGNYASGDIFYPNGVNSPAKGVRGNVLVNNGVEALTSEGGIRYLK